MGRAPCCDKLSVKRGPWSPEEDAKLKEFIDKYGTGGNWITFPHKAGLKRCGKSCRLRWLNYLRPNIKHGDFTDDEDRIICSLFTTIGTRWSVIAAQLPGRTDNDIKNYWNTKLKKKLMGLISVPRMKPNPTMVSSPLPHMASNVLSFTSPTTLSSSCNNSSIDINTRQSQPYNYYDLTPKNNLALVRDQASCSSSERSSGGNHLGYGEYDYGSGGGYENRGKMGHFEKNLGGEIIEVDTVLQELVEFHESGVMKKDHGGCSEKESVVWKEEITPLECSLEEIKRLISSNCSDNNVSFDQSYNNGEKFTCYY